MSIANRIRYILQNYVPRSLMESTMRRRYFSSNKSLDGSMDERFTKIHDENLWGSDESISGPGSTLERSEQLRRALPGLISVFNAKVFLDVPCGDFHWMQNVDFEDCYYIGGDIVDGLVKSNQEKYGNEKRRFMKLDIVNDPIPPADMLLVRDCFIHLPFELINKAIKNIARSHIRYLLTTTYSYKRHNYDIPIGKFRGINLTRYPFNLPPPLRMIREDTIQERPDHERHIGIWEIWQLAHLREDAGQEQVITPAAR